VEELERENQKRIWKKLILNINKHDDKRNFYEESISISSSF
jgi:hypothetical protein